MAAITSYQNWPVSLVWLLLAGGFYVMTQAVRRHPLPKGAPGLVKQGLPFFGMQGFFYDRVQFFKAGFLSSKTGNFSFTFGQNKVVGLSGPEGRRTFFETKELNIREG